MNTEINAVKCNDYATAVAFCNIVVAWYAANADSVTESVGEFEQLAVDREWSLLRKMTAAMTEHPALLAIYISLLEGNADHLSLKKEHLSMMLKDLGFEESQIKQYIELTTNMDRFLFGMTEGKKPSNETVSLRLMYLKGWEEKYLM